METKTSLDETKLLSAPELFRYHLPSDKTLPQKGGQKEYAPDGSWLQAKRLEKFYQERQHVLSEQRVEKWNNLIIGEWNPDNHLVEFRKKMGKFWLHMGFVDDRRKWLYPEEALFLMESNCLEVLYGDVPLSIQEAYRAFLGTSVSLEEYQVYAHLRRLGFVVLRHADIGQYERKIRLDQHIVTNKRRKRILNEESSNSMEVASLEILATCSESVSSPTKRCKQAPDSQTINEKLEKEKGEFGAGPDRGEPYTSEQTLIMNVNERHEHEVADNGMSSLNNTDTCIKMSNDSDNTDCCDSRQESMLQCSEHYNESIILCSLNTPKYIGAKYTSWNFNEISIPNIADKKTLMVKGPLSSRMPVNVDISDRELDFDVELYNITVSSRRRKFNDDVGNDMLEFSFGEWFEKKKIPGNNWQEYKVNLSRSQGNVGETTKTPADHLWKGQVTPLVKPEHATCTADVLERLRVIKSTDLLQTSKSFRYLHFLLGNKGAHILFGNIKEMECLKCHKTYKSMVTYNKHKCSWCELCCRIYSSYQRYKFHKCYGNQISTKTSTPSTQQVKETSSSSSELQTSAILEDPLLVKTKHVQTSTVSKPSSQCTKQGDDLTPERKKLSKLKENSPGQHTQKEKSSSTQHPQESMAAPLSAKTGCKFKIEHEGDNNESTSSTQRDMQIPKEMHTPCSEKSKCVRIHTTTQINFTFCRVNVEWQLQICQQLGLLLVNILIDVNNVMSTGRPKSVISIAGDGNCFFRCLSYIITGSEALHGELRALVLSHMNTVRSLIENFCLNPGTSLPVYLASSNMTQSGTWATDVEIFAAAHLLHTDILIYSCGNNNRLQAKWYKFSGKAMQRNLTISNRSVFINHRNGNHYEIVLDVHPAGVGQAESLDVKKHETVSYKWLVHELNRQILSTSQTGKKHPFESNATVKGCTKIMSSMIPEKSNHNSQIDDKKMTAKIVNLSRKEKDRLRKQQKRQDPDFRKKEAVWEKQGKRPKRKNLEKQKKAQNVHNRENEQELKDIYRRRENLDYKIKEREQQRKGKRQRREDPDFRSKEREQELKCKRRRRNDPDCRSKEREEELKGAQRRRDNPDYRNKEREQEIKSKHRRREDPDCRSIEREKEIKSKRRKRENPDYRSKERVKEIKSKHRRREDPDCRSKEREQELKGAQRRRDNPEYRNKEREQEIKSKRRMRDDPDCRSIEREKEIKSKRRKRENPDYRSKERVKEIKSKHRRREDPDCRSKEREQELKGAQRRRDNPEYRNKEREQEIKSKRRMRDDPDCRSIEREKEIKSKRRRRENPDYRSKERVKEIKSKHRRREDPDCRSKERKTGSKQKTKRRKDKDYREKESLRIKRHKIEKRQQKLSVEEMQKKFHFNIKCGPEFICTCCNGLFYKHSVNLIIRKSLESKNIPASLIDSCLHNTVSYAGAEWICKTCYKYLLAGKIPPMALANGLGFPECPLPLKELTTLEERCISPRIPFMQIRELGRDHQFGIRGNVVNVPVNISTTLSLLPRKFSDTETIQLKLMRRLKYKRAYHYETVRPYKIFDATNWLVENSPIYKDEGIQLDPTWMKDYRHTTASVDFITTNKLLEVDSKNDAEAVDLHDNKEKNGFERTEAEDDWVELSTEEQYAGGNRDTMLQPNDFTSDGQHALRIAPGEGNHPINIFLDKDCEEKSFPSIFCGQRRPSNDQRIVPVTYSSICKAEIRNADRRAAMSVSNLFFKLKKLQTLQIRDLAMTALRKTKDIDATYTAGNLKKPGALDDLVHVNQGYRVLKTLRSSPPYWQARQKDIFAMIRQLGIPTFFASFSAAETRWPDVLKILSRTVTGKDLTDQDIQNLSWKEKSHLIQSDPVTSARHFDYKVNLFLNSVLRSTSEPIGKIIDFYYRVEFQQRGSPHIHCLYWIECAPQYEKNNNQDVINFIDKYITCRKCTEPSDRMDVSALHEHKHSKTCKKGGKHVCRFGFPVPPMSATAILEPLSDDIPKEETTQHRGNFEALKKMLQDIKSVEDMSHEDLLGQLNVTQKQYILAVRSSLKKPQVFVKRACSEIRMNTRNDTCAKIWQANTDLQFILDAYGCVVYIASYMLKSQRGMSMLLQQASEEAQKGTYGIKEQIKIIANKFLNNCEISAQEAVYLLLQLPMCRSSRDTIFINTSPKADRVVIIKKKSILATMPDDSTEIACASLIDRYESRPSALEQLSLAEFATSFERKVKIHPRKVKSTNELPEEYYEEDFMDDPYRKEESGQEYQLPDGSTLYRRQRPKILRCVRYSKELDAENYYREKLMLYVPWRSEHLDKLESTLSYEERYNAVHEQVTATESMYEHNAAILDHALEEQNTEEKLEHGWDSIAPQTNDLDEQQCNDEYAGDTSMSVLYPQSTNHQYYDIGEDIGCPHVEQMQHDLIPLRISHDDYDKLMNSLNMDQLNFLYHIIHLQKTAGNFSCFLSGGAGVGKSRCLLAIYHTLIKWYDRQPGQNPEEVKILLTAPTGKAAYNIHGTTLHAAFLIPANQKLEYKNLDQSRLNTLRCKLKEVKLLIIDEISMVGSTMFNFINQRLQDVMGCSQPFGGVNLLLVGDLFQLRPVKDQWIFKCVIGPYASLAPILWRDIVKMFELKQIMRQKDDEPFANALNRIREGKQKEEDINMMKSRIMPEGECCPENVLHLYTQHDFVRQHNDSVLEELSTSGQHVFAQDSVLGDVTAAVKYNVLAKAADTKAQLTQNLMYDLHIKIDGRYMLVHNISTADGLTNGATCIVKSLTRTANTASAKPCIVWVLFDDSTIGQKSRNENKHYYTRDINPEWTPVFEVHKRFRVGHYKQIEILRRQFPLHPSAAMTIHKSQGSTLDKLVLSFKGFNQAHLVYVGVSRVRSLAGLYLKDFDSSKICVSRDVVEEMVRLRQQGFTLSYQLLNELTQYHKIVFHNTRSLHKHVKHLRFDSNLRSADILVMQETWQSASDPLDYYALDNFSIFSHGNVACGRPEGSIRPHGGTLVYFRNDRNIKLCDHSNFLLNGIEIVIIDASYICSNLKLISIYRPPTVKFSHFLTAMQNMFGKISCKDKLVIGGDFNISSSGEGHTMELTRYMSSRWGLQQLVHEPTTDYGSSIDLIFTNIDRTDRQSGVLECWYSDHKPTWIAIQHSQ